MGLLDRAKPRQKVVEELEKKEIEFVLSKLRTAHYTGNEFEMFYKVFMKLTDMLEKDK